MTLITGQVADVGMNNASGVFYARATEFRGDGTTVVSPSPATFTITGGVVSAEVEPGPTIITLHVGPIRKDWFVNVPEADVGLGDLIATYTTYEPAVVSAAIAARDAAIEAESEAKQAAIDAEARRAAAETAADLTGADRLHVDGVRALLDEAYDQSQAGMTLPPRLTETVLNATYASRIHTPLQLLGALADRDARPIIGIIIGSSSVWGSGLSDLTQRLASRVEKMLQASYNPAGIAGGYSIAMRDTTSGVSGGTLPSNTWYPSVEAKGLGHSRRALAAGQTLTWTAPACTGFTFGFKSGTGMGSLEIAVDGGAPYSVTPNTFGPESWDAQHTTAVLARGPHTLTITAVGGPQYFDFGYVHDGDHHAGIRLYNNGWGGHTILEHNADTETIAQRFAQIKPDFVIVYTGGNEAVGGIPYNDLVGPFRGLLDKLRAANGGTDTDMPWVAFVPQARHYAVAAGYDYHDNLVRAMRDVAAENPNFCSFHPGTENPFPPSQVEDNAWLNAVSSDDVHPTAIGHQMIADLMADELRLPSKVATRLSPPAVGGTPVTVGGGAGADPSVILEMDGDTLAGAQDTVVTSWADTAGRTTFTPSGTGDDPTLVTDFGGHNAVKIKGRLLDATVPAHIGPVSVTVVFRAAEFSGALIGRQQSADAYSWIMSPGSGTIQSGSGSGATAVSAAGVHTPGTRYVVTATHDGATTRLYLNGTQIASGPYTPNAASGVGPGVRLGGSTGATNTPLRADLAYVLVRKGASTPSEVSALASTLATKYGIAL